MRVEYLFLVLRFSELHITPVDKRVLQSNYEFLYVILFMFVHGI